MIALIKFNEEMCIKREVADSLKVNYEEVSRVGYGLDYSNRVKNKLSKMDANAMYMDDVEIEVDEDGNPKKFFTKCENRKEVSSYRVYKRPKDEVGYVYVPDKNHLVDLEEFALECPYEYKIEKCIKTKEPTVQNVQSLLNKVEEKTLEINKAIDAMKSQAFNQRANVHVGGGLMVTYNDLCLKEDCCTDELQSCLNDGWRIIAVCVQPDQRRPDYILGRYNPKMDVFDKGNSADR